MISQFFKFLVTLSPNLKRFLWRKWYQIMAKKYQLPDWNFMNYGYAELDGYQLDLQSYPEKDRYFIQLYHFVAAAVNINGKKVEVTKEEFFPVIKSKDKYVRGEELVSDSEDYFVN